LRRGSTPRSCWMMQRRSGCRWRSSTAPSHLCLGCARCRPGTLRMLNGRCACCAPGTLHTLQQQWQVAKHMAAIYTCSVRHSQWGARLHAACAAVQRAQCQVHAGWGGQHLLQGYDVASPMCRRSLFARGVAASSARLLPQSCSVRFSIAPNTCRT
jgi:hypothetical protein